MLKTIVLRSTLIATAWSISVAAYAYADPKPTNVPAGDLIAGLELLTKQSGVELVYQPGQLKGLRTQGVSGTLEPRDAVTKLLEGTPLQLRTDSTGAMLITAPQPNAGPADAGSGKPSAAAGSPGQQNELAQTAKPSQGVLEEIVVTANKRVENVQNVAASVSVESGEKLAERGQSQLSDYAAYMPGLNVSSSGAPGEESSVSLRGISTGTSTPAVGTYLDDVPMGGSSGWVNSAYTFLDMLPYDLDRLEVLRGPQGTLYGAGAMGGLIKYVLKSPSTSQFQANVGADISTIDGAGSPGYSFQARANAPVIDHVLGISLSVFDKKTPGFMTNEYTGARHTNDDRQYGARLAALWTPSSTVSVKLTSMLQKIEADDVALKQFTNTTTVPTGSGAVVLAPSAALADLTENVAFQSPYNQRISFNSATVNWNPGPFSLVSATSWSAQRSFYAADISPQLGTILQDLGGTGPGLVQFSGDFGLDKFTQELRLVSPQGQTVEWLVGAFYTHESSSNNQYEKAYNYDYTPVSGGLAFPPGLILLNLPELYDEDALFGDLTWRLTDAFSVTAGARYAHNDQDVNWNIAPGPLVSETGRIHIGAHEGVFTWMGSAQYHFDKDTMAYARVATGYRPGGPNFPVVGIPLTYGSDSLINYELGLKSTFLDHKAQVDFTVYRIDWKDIQLIAVENNLSFDTNGGKATSQGVEFTGTYSPIHPLTLGFNAAYTDAHLTSLIDGTSYLLTSYQLPNVPKESFSVTADYNWPLSAGWTGHLGGGYRYLGAQWLSLVESASLATTPTVRVPAYSVVDLTASMRKDHLTLKVYARNLANNRAIVGGSEQGPIVTNSQTGATQVLASFLQPRTIGVGFDYEF